MLGSLALVAGAAAACTDDEPAPAPVGPDPALRAEAADRERVLLAAYDRALDALGATGMTASALADVLRGVRGEHAVHLEALVGPPPSMPPSASPSASPAPSPLSPEKAVAGLADLERLASAAHAGGAVRASRSLAGLLASLAASEHTHPAVLAVGPEPA